MNPDTQDQRRRRTAGRSAVAAVLALVVVAGCRQDMHDQPKLKPYRGSAFFADGRGMRPPVPGTVARGQLNEDRVLQTGKVGKEFVDDIPLPVGEAFLERGRQRFDIYCSPCHARTGEGDGMVVRRGYRKPPSFHADRLRAVPVGYIFDVESKGFGVMPSYAAQIPVRDRWAIAAYVRALQVSRHATLADVPPAQREVLSRSHD